MFAKELKQLLNICHLKTSHLATFLGYDFSYISKWFTESRLPSIKNNESIFDKIAQFIIQNADEKSTQQIYSQIERVSDPNETLLINLSNYLRYCYECQKNQNKSKHSEIYNCYLEFGNSDNMIDMIKTNISDVWNDQQPVEIISTIPLQNYVDGFDLIGLLKWYISKNKQVRFIQAVSKNESESMEWNSVLSELLNISEKLELLFFECDSVCLSQRTILINQNAAIFQIEHVLYKDPLWCFTRDEKHLRHIMNQIHPMMVQMHSVFEHLGLDTEKVMDYFTEPNSKYILTSMQPLYMEMDVLQDISKDIVQAEKEKNNLIYHVGIKTSKKVIVFKSAIIDYFTNHQIELYGKNINMKQNECATHLRYIAKKFREFEESELFILNDTNPIFNCMFNQMNLYLNEKSIRITKKEDDQVKFSIVISAKPIVNALNRLFDSYCRLDSDYCLSDEEALDYIEHLAQLLE